jgi:hypothetical protein
MRAARSPNADVTIAELARLIADVVGFDAGADVDRLLFRPMFHQKDHRVGQVVDMQELTAGVAAAPELRLTTVIL